MKRLWIVLTLFFILALIIGVTGCISPCEFQLTEWQMIDDNGRPALEIAFKSAGKVHLTLIDPDGIVVDEIMSIPEGVTGAKLYLHGGIGEIPKAGQYRLIAREYKINGEIIATETLSFEGAKATISDVKLTWGYWTQGYVSLKDIRYDVRNDGDIPVYIRKCKLVIGDKESSSGFNDAHGDVPPGDEKTIYTRTFVLTNIIPGEYAANLELRDGTDKVVCSYSFAVASAVTKETEFKITQWEVIEDHVGKPALRLRFTIYENKADLYLTNPDGVQTDSATVMVGMNEITLCLAGSDETPDAGQYTLIAKDSLGKIIAKEEFYFEGAEATISNVELTWDYIETFESSSLERISFIVSNNGDLPAYIHEARIAIGDEVYRLPIIGTLKVYPGETKTFEESLIFTGITSRDKEFTLELKDKTGKVVGSYSRNVTPTTDSISVSSTIIIIGSVMWGSVPVPGAIVVLKGTGNYYTMPVLSHAEVGADGRFKVEYTQAGSYMIYAVSPSDEYWTFTGQSITLLADQTIDAGTFYLKKKLKLLEPANLATVSTATPTLRWMSFPDATRYHVNVFNKERGQAVLRQDTTNTSLIIAQPLASGVRYEWSVIAYNAANIRIAYYSPWYFTVQT